MLYLKLLEKQKQAKPKQAEGQIIKIRAEINDIDTKKTKTYKESTKKKLVL
jgi:hypothetical protein